MELNLVTEGLKFMVLGMSAVFLFLMLMVWVLRVQFTIISKFFPPKTTSSLGVSSNTSSSSNLEDASHIAVITAAIQTFRQQQRD